MNNELTDKKKILDFLFSEEEQAKEQRIYFRDLFRDARAKALNNAENFEDLIFALEKLGKFLYCETKEIVGLSKFGTVISNLADYSVLAKKIPNDYPKIHSEFSTLYNLVTTARNSAMHEGAFARHLTQHAIEVSIILEDALMSQEKQVKDFMVRNPICAYLWQPISFIRQNMLANSFSYLPVCKNKKWKLISDFEIAKYLGNSEGGDKRAKLSRKLGDAIKDKDIKLISTENIEADYLVANLLEKSRNGLPVCITENSSGEIVGILTPFDLL